MTAGIIPDHLVNTRKFERQLSVLTIPKHEWMGQCSSISPTIPMPSIIGVPIKATSDGLNWWKLFKPQTFFLLGDARACNFFWLAPCLSYHLMLEGRKNSWMSWKLNQDVFFLSPTTLNALPRQGTWLTRSGPLTGFPLMQMELFCAGIVPRVPQH